MKRVNAGELNAVVTETYVISENLFASYFICTICT
jgi:hypothetical protein